MAWFLWHDRNEQRLKIPGPHHQEFHSSRLCLSIPLSNLAETRSNACQTNASVTTDRARLAYCSLCFKNSASRMTADDHAMNIIKQIWKPFGSCNGIGHADIHAIVSREQTMVWRLPALSVMLRPTSLLSHLVGSIWAGLQGRQKCIDASNDLVP